MLHPPTFRSRVPVIETLAIANVVLAVVATLAGLFWPGGDGSYTVTTYRGQEEEILGGASTATAPSSTGPARGAPTLSRS